MNNPETWKFLDELVQFLDEELAKVPNLIQTIDEQRSKARTELTKDPQGTWWEGAFLNYHIFPKLHEYLMKTQNGWDSTRAKQALLLEGYTHHRAISSGSPASSARYPFAKDSGFSPEEIIQRWRDSRFTGACPDFAFCDPYKVVGEAKYFRKGNAATTLVSAIYETFFYRGLPSRRLDAEDIRDWDYEFGLLLAYDASPRHSLAVTWRSIPEKVRRTFWETANLYIAILPLIR
jgi:hypothetical protein